MKKRKPITIEKYNKKMENIIQLYKNKDIDECLIALLDEASKWDIVSKEQIVLKA